MDPIGGSNMEPGRVPEGGRVVTNAGTARRAIDSADAPGPPRVGGIERADAATRAAAEARAERSEARREMFAVAKRVDDAERELASARAAGDPKRVRSAEATMNDAMAQLRAETERVTRLVGKQGQPLSPDRVLSLLTWRPPPTPPTRPTPPTAPAPPNSR